LIKRNTKEKEKIEQKKRRGKEKCGKKKLEEKFGN
jgi:hypothetical protein